MYNQHTQLLPRNTNTINSPLLPYIHLAASIPPHHLQPISDALSVAAATAALLPRIDHRHQLSIKPRRSAPSVGAPYTTTSLLSDAGTGPQPYRWL